MNRFGHHLVRDRSALTVALCVAANLLSATPSARADQTFIEPTFGPGTFTPLPAFLYEGVPVGATGGASTVQVNINNNPMLEQTLQLTLPGGGFPVVFAPVMLNNFVHDPAIHGPIGTITASIKTFSNPNAGAYFGSIRVWVTQNNRLYMLSNLAPEDTFYGFSFDEPDRTRTTTGRTAADFIEIVNNAFVFDSHPDFNGAPLRFGFGCTLTPTGLPTGPHQTSLRFDTAIIRTYTPVPECLGDLNNDGLRNTTDLTIFLGSFGQNVPIGTVGDLNNDGVVNTSDLTVFLGLFGVDCN